MNIERDAEIKRLVSVGYGNRRIAKLAKCSRQNIEQIRRRMTRENPKAFCVKPSDSEREAKKMLLDMQIRVLLGMSYEDAVTEVFDEHEIESNEP